MSRAERRLRALEQKAPAVQPGGITQAEWVQWRTSGQQPERWLGSPALQAQAAEMLSTIQARLIEVQAYEDGLIGAYLEAVDRMGQEGYE